MNESRCNLCLKVKPLCNSHIIPKSFFEKSNVLVSENGKYPKRRPIGGYDRLLCRECEQYLSTELENDAKKILVDKDLHKVVREQISIPKHEPIIIYRLRDPEEYKKIDRFFISILWKASISTIDDFKGIRLGDVYEAKARLAILDENYDFTRWFAVIILFTFSDLETKINLTSGLQCIEGINCYHLLVGSIKACVKCDTSESLCS